MSQDEIIKNFIITFYSENKEGELKPIVKTIASGKNNHEASIKASVKLIDKHPDVAKNLWMSEAHYGEPV